MYYCLISLNSRSSLGGIKTMLKGSKTDEKVTSLKVKAYINIFALNLFSIFEVYYSPNLFIKIFQEKINETVIY